VDIKGILKTSKVIAVLGASKDEFATSNNITKYLINRGYTVYPVNPKYKGEFINEREILPNLKDVPEPIDIINVFRRSVFIADHVDEMIAVKPRNVWFQLGISCPESFERLENAGIVVVRDRCIYQTLLGEL